jgi:hypothetical protein
VSGAIELLRAFTAGLALALAATAARADVADFYRGKNLSSG